MEKNVSVVDVNPNQKKLQVQIPALLVQREFDSRYRELSKQIRIKGFRPGKVPKNIIKSYYGKTIESEVSSHLIQESFSEALREVNLNPLVEADVSEMKFEEDGAFTYAAVLEVCPPFTVEGYRGLQVERPSLEITDEQVSAELERIREQHTQLRTIETPKPVAEGDVVLVDFTPLVDGVVFERGQARDYMVDIGKNSLHPDFDTHLIGRMVGETITFDLDYPEDAPTKEIAGKRVTFEVTIKELKEKLLPELNDEFAKDLGSFETLEELRNTIYEKLHQREKDRISSEVRQQIIDQMVSKIHFEVSPKVIDREVDHLIELFQRQFQSQGLKLDLDKFNTPEIRAEYRPQAERNVKWRLIAAQLASQENIQLTDEELDEIFKDIARLTRMDVETIKKDYSESMIVVQAKDRKLQDKVLTFLEACAENSDKAVPESGSKEED